MITLRLNLGSSHNHSSTKTSDNLNPQPSFYYFKYFVENKSPIPSSPFLVWADGSTTKFQLQPLICYSHQKFKLLSMMTIDILKSSNTKDELCPTCFTVCTSKSITTATVITIHFVCTSSTIFTWITVTLIDVCKRYSFWITRQLLTIVPNYTRYIGTTNTFPLASLSMPLVLKSFFWYIPVSQFVPVYPTLQVHS